MPEITVAIDTGNLVRFRTEDGAEVVQGTPTMLLPRKFVACFPDEQNGPELHLRVEVRDGVPRVREVFLQARPDGRDIRATDVRSAADLDFLLQLACEMVTWHVEADFPGGDVRAHMSYGSTEIEAAAAAVRKSRRNTRRAIPDARLAEVAATYRANPAAPVKAVEKEFGLAPRTAALYVKRARDHGLLEPSPRARNVP